MSSNRERLGVKLSILDRITGLSPDKLRAHTVVRNSPTTVAEFKATVQRDLAMLLNTRRADEPVPMEFTEAFRSVAAFGLPDFTGCSAMDRSVQERFRLEIQDAIRLFEPRLSDVTVSLDRSSARTGGKDGQLNSSGSSLRYHVRALLKVEPEPEPYSFDAVLEPGSGRVDLEKPRSSR